MKKLKWTALYLPASDKNISKSFSTKKEAIEYIKKFFCMKCKTMDSSCGCEWLILPFEELEKCEDMDAVFKLAGYKKIK